MKRRDFIKAGIAAAGGIGIYSAVRKYRSVGITGLAEGEILDQRGVHQKVFALGGSKRRYLIHSKPIHYDTGGQYEDIHIQLRDTGTDYLTDQNKLSVGFRKDGNLYKMMGVRKDANHRMEFTPRRIVLNENEITLPDQFTGINLVDDRSISHQLPGGLSLKTTVHECYARTALQAQDVTDFLVEEEIHLKGYNIINPYVEKNGEKHFTPIVGKGFVFQNIDDSEDVIWINTPIVWHDNDGMQDVDFSIIQNTSGQIIFQKSPNETGKEWLKENTGVLLNIDGTAYYSSTKDGYIQNNDMTSWASCRSAETGSIKSDGGSQHSAACAAGGYGGSMWSITRSFFYFDTQGIDDGATVDSCDLYLHGYWGNGETYVSAMKGTQGATLATADFDSFTGSEYGHSSGTWDNEDWNTISFNAQGKSDIAKDGETKVCCREYTYDYSDSDPGSTTHHIGMMYTESDDDPYLDITTSGGGGGWTGKVNEVTDPGKVSGLENANISKVSGV